MHINNVNDLNPVHATSNQNYLGVKKYSGFLGRFLCFFGAAIKIQDEVTHQISYRKITDITRALVGNNVTLSKKSEALIQRRIVEIVAPDSRKEGSAEKINNLFNRFYEVKAQAADHLNAESAIVQELEKIKLEMSDIRPIYYENSLLELVHELKPGDIIVRKYHEDNPNVICNLQKILNVSGYREAFKCSHMSLYLGKINGDHWIGEAVMPDEADAQVRRIKIDEPRFNPLKKNQYLIFRKNNQEHAQESARLACNYTIKLLPKDIQKRTHADNKGTLKYNYIEAARSLWHSSAMDVVARHRILKFYSDYKNQVGFEYLGKKRGFFCSQFALIMESMAELNKSVKFQNFLKKHPIPLSYDKTKRGLALKISKLWYSIRKGFWSRYMAIRYKKTIEECLTTKLDILRTSPHKTVQYMLDHPHQYSVIGLATRKGDFHKEN